MFQPRWPEQSPPYPQVKEICDWAPRISLAARMFLVHPRRLFFPNHSCSTFSNSRVPNTFPRSELELFLHQA